MKFSIQKLPKSQIEIYFELPIEEFAQYYNEAIFNLGKELKIEGFRPGNAPKEIVEKNLNQEKILGEAANLAVKENYVRVILENKIEAISQPEIEILKMPAPYRADSASVATSAEEAGSGAGALGNPFEFRAKTWVLPEVVPPDYKKIASEVKKEEIKIDEKEIEDNLKWLQRSRAKFTLKQEPCEKGDFVEIIYSSPQIGSGQETKDGFILGEGHFVPGFEDNLEGMKINEEKNLSLDFPKERKGDLSGKRADFKVKINNVQKMDLPEVNDDLAKGLGNFENLEDLKKNIKAGITLEKEVETRRKRRAEILEKISEDTVVEMPEVLIESQKNQMLEDFKNNIKSQLQISFEDYLKKIQKSEADIKESLSGDAAKLAKNFLILREIAQKENIQIFDEEIKEKINEFLKHYPDIKKAEKEVDLDKLKSYYEGVIRDEKVFQILENV